MRALALLALLLVGACSLGGTVANQAADYNLAVEQAANTQLLRNVLRARDQLPLHFTTVPQIRGSLSIGLSQPGLGLPVSGSQQGLNLGLLATSSPSFDVSALDTQEFTRGLLEPLEPDLFRYYLERGYSEQMLLLLMFNSVADPQSGRRVLNDPRCWFERPDCPAPMPARLIEAAFLTDGVGGRYEFHDYTALTPLGPPLSAAQAGDPGLLASLADGKLTLRPAAGGRFQLYRQEAQFAACRRVQREGRQLRVAMQDRLRPGGSPPPPSQQCAQDEVVVGQGAPAGRGVQIQLRSVADIIRWLGLVLRVQQELEATPGEEPPCLAFRPAATRPGMAAREVCTFRLARPGEVLPTGTAFELEYGSATWRVPRFAEPAPDGSRRGDYTTQVLALLTELVNLKKASDAIPSTRAVRVLR